MIRVCLVAPGWMTGGQAVEARTLINGFATDPDVRVELQPIDPRILGTLARVRGLRTLVRLPLFYYGIVKRILRSNVVHVFTAAFWPFFLTTTPAILLGRLFRRPVILNYRDGRARDHIRYRAVRWVLRRATVLVFPSGFLRDVFAEFGLQGIVVSNVVDTERFRFRTREPLRPVLLSVRLLEQLYDVENTIRAHQELRRHVPEARLLIVGDGDRRPALEALIASQEIEGVEFAGAVSHQSIGEWFDRADILVNSSLVDNMPHCLIEAFAAGMPVVTTPSGGIPHIVQHEHNGLHVPCGDPKAMASAVQRLLDDPALAHELIVKGRAECDARYSWAVARGEWVRLYQGLVARPASRRWVAATPQNGRPHAGTTEPGKRAIRVLIVAPAHMIGGQAHAARDIALGFADDAEVSVSVQAIDPRLGGAFAWLTDAKFLRTLIRPALFARQLLRTARQADVLQVLGAAHTAFLFGAFPAIIIGRLLRRPIILNYHDGRAREHFHYWGPFLRRSLRRVDCLVVPSRYLQKEFAAQGFAAEVVPNVVNTDAFVYRVATPLRHRLVSTRLLEPLYAIETTLLAFEKLRAEFPDLVLDIYGSGAAGRELRALSGRLGLQGVTFHGEIPHARMPEILAQGGIMVNSSRVDNMPHFVLEAYAAGLPIVSTAVGGIPYMIDPDRTGLLVPPDDPAQLAAAIARLLSDPELAARLGEAGHQETPRYTWSRAREEWRRIYRKFAVETVRQEGA